ncbi:MAG TPA: hypothetical protein VFW42_10435, partial [Fluviicoccus sp.]|nr:hypothetical protein [Fluviicoccus sp.]
HGCFSIMGLLYQRRKSSYTVLFTGSRKRIPWWICLDQSGLTQPIQAVVQLLEGQDGVVDAVRRGHNARQIQFLCRLSTEVQRLQQPDICPFQRWHT